MEDFHAFVSYCIGVGYLLAILPAVS